MSGAATAPELPQRLTLIVDLLRRHLAAHAAKDRAFAPLLLILWSRLSRTLARIAAIAQRHHAGTLRKPRTPPLRRPASAAAPRKPPPRDPLPRARAWLLRRVPGCVSYGEYLRLLLEEPQTRALIEAAPQLRPLLRPLWRMLRTERVPEVLQPPRAAVPTPRRARKPRPSPPRAARTKPARTKPARTKPARTKPAAGKPVAAGPARQPGQLPGRPRRKPRAGPPADDDLLPAWVPRLGEPA